MLLLLELADGELLLCDPAHVLEEAHRTSYPDLTTPPNDSCGHDSLFVLLNAKTSFSKEKKEKMGFLGGRFAFDM